MQPRKNLKGAAAGFIGVGVAFLAISLGGQTAFMGIGMAFFAIGIAFLAKSRRGG